MLQISSSIMSSANILHFDLSSGCTVQALIASLTDLGAAISPKKVKPDPISLALVQKTEACLLEAGFKASTSETNLITQFCLLLTDLDPKAISATRIPLSFDPQHPGRTVLLKLSEFVPIYETEWPGSSFDILSLALLKICVSHFGVRGESRLIKMGLSSQPEIRALWCEPAPLATRSILGPSAEPRVASLLEISALITNPNLIPEITHRLNQIGAKKTWTTQILEQGTQPKTLFTLIISEADQHQAIEVLLILGQASEVYLNFTDQHSLQKKIISVTLGLGQKQQVCRVTEYFWGDRVLRVDPLPEDLINLSKSTGNPQEIIRADVLSAWKKRSS